MLSRADTITALLGRFPVANDRMARYCRLSLSSPSRKAVPLAFFVEPPTPLVSDDSSTQPSWGASDLRVITEIGTVVNDHQPPLATVNDVPFTALTCQ